MSVQDYADAGKGNNRPEYAWLTKEETTACMKIKEALHYLARGGDGNNNPLCNRLTVEEVMACISIIEGLLCWARDKVNKLAGDEWFTKDEAMAYLKIKQGLLYKYIGLKEDPLIVHQ